ncbi:uncharacterized protein LOC131293167 [Anopheles ziemanni]|uniref:uncharacterized protein LOC131293167 n=1 Tax=Anopheles ziemanni TaxID=345580 RepID=UPI00265EAE38|nr:uncharacterized protein LOC131293167 [Anopheles ziemanni]
MEDRLVTISTSDWKEWRDLYKTDWPQHEVSYNLIQNYIDWQEQGVDLKEFMAFSLNGEWAKDGTYIVIDRNEMFIYTLDTSLESLRRALLLLDWTRSYMINMGLYKSLVIEIYQLFNLETLFDKHTCMYYLPHEDARNLVVQVPDGFKFGSLKFDDAIFINAEWPHKYPGSELFIERLITRNLNLGLFDGDGKLMAWCMRVQNGAMGMLGVAQTRRGYGSMMALGFARKLGELGLNAYASVIDTNEPSRKLFHNSNRHSSRCFGRHRSGSIDRYHRKCRSNRSRSDSSDRNRCRSQPWSPVRGHSSTRKLSSHRAEIRVDSPEPNRCLGVFGLTVYTTEQYLKDIFEQYGIVEDLLVIYDSQTRLSRGFGFVYYQNVAEAIWARMHCNGFHVHGRRIRVDFSITDRPHLPTPGICKGRRSQSRSVSPLENSIRECNRHSNRRSRSTTKN